MKPQTKRAYEYIQHSIILDGFAPSVQDLADAMGYKSKRSAALIIEELIENGLLQRRENGSRQLQLVGQRQAAKASASIVQVPLVGRASCGPLMLAEENVEATIPVSTGLARPPHRYFILRAQGNSMNKAGIQDGEFVLIRQQPTAQAGDKVVALIDDEATIKEFQPHGNTVVLMPRSTDKTIQPIVMEADFQIQGVVIVTLPPQISPALTDFDEGESP